MNKPAPYKWYAFVPNLITLLNLVCGTIAIYFAIQHKIEVALSLMFAGALFDFIDGLTARLLKVSGELGKQLDSLADVITFGLLPTAMIFSVQQNLLLEKAGSYDHFSFLQWGLLISPILIAAFSALRLAKFNIDTRQSHSFIGLPTPANALFFASMSWSIVYGNNLVTTVTSNSITLFILTIIFSLLLVSEVPMFSLKFSSLKGKENVIRYIFLVCSLFLILLLKISGITAVVLLYIVISFLNNLFVKK